MTSKAPPKQARLLTSEPLTPKNKAASEAQDARIAAGFPSIEAAFRDSWIEHLVKLYRIDPQASRESLIAHNRADEIGQHRPNLGASVKARLIELGLIKENP